MPWRWPLRCPLHNYLGTEHLLLALVRHRELLPDSVGALLPRAEDVESRLAVVMGEPRSRDAELLKLVGIDLEAVRASVRHTFGSDALDQSAIDGSINRGSRGGAPPGGAARSSRAA